MLIIYGFETQKCCAQLKHSMVVFFTGEFFIEKKRTTTVGGKHTTTLAGLRRLNVTRSICKLLLVSEVQAVIVLTRSIHKLLLVSEVLDVIVVS